MSYISNIVQSCPNLQDRLVAHFSACPILENYPFYQFMLSETNTSGIQQAVHPASGKRRTVELRYQQRYLESNVTEGFSDFCSSENEPGDSIETYTIDDSDRVGISSVLNVEHFAEACDSTASYLAAEVARLIDVVERKVATKYANEAALLTGKWSSDVTVNAQDELELDVELTSGELNHKAAQILARSLQKTGYCDTPIVFAGDDYVNYAEALQAGCCANQGVDLSAILAKYGKATLYDKRIAAALNGDEYGIVLQPKALQPLFYTKGNWKNEALLGVFAGTPSSYTSTTIVSPNGLPLDVFISDNCTNGGQITISVSVSTKLVGMPSDMFAIGDDLDGVTFVNKIKVV
jgi:hypothetical protein